MRPRSESEPLPSTQVGLFIDSHRFQVRLVEGQGCTHQSGADDESRSMDHIGRDATGARLAAARNLPGHKNQAKSSC